MSSTGADVSAQRVFQNTPRNSGNIRATYDWDMPVMGNNGTLSLIASLTHRGKTYQFETPNPVLDQEAYRLVDASIVWTSRDNKVRVGLHGKNLNDTRYKVAGYFFPTLGEGSVTAFYGAPRTVTATLDYRF